MLIAIFRNVLPVSNSSSSSVSFLTLGQNVFGLPLLVTEFQIVKLSDLILLSVHLLLVVTIGYKILSLMDSMKICDFYFFFFFFLLLLFFFFFFFFFFLILKSNYFDFVSVVI